MEAKPSLNIVVRTWRKIMDQNLFLVSAGVSFYWLLGFIPGLAAVITLYGFFARKSDVESLFLALGPMFPGVTHQFLQTQVHSIAEEAVKAGTGSLFAGFFALWLNFNAVKAVVKACNIICDVEKDKRPTWPFQAFILGLTLFGILLCILSVFIIVGLPYIVSYLEWAPKLQAAILSSRWAVLALIGMLSLAILYRFGPYREDASWKLASWGAVIATALWLAASYCFSLYVASFQTYNRMYGSFGWFIAVMLWFWISVGSVLLGIMINHELECHGKEAASS